MNAPPISFFSVRSSTEQIVLRQVHLKKWKLQESNPGIFCHEQPDLLIVVFYNLLEILFVPNDCKQLIIRTIDKTFFIGKVVSCKDGID